MSDAASVEAQAQEGGGATAALCPISAEFLPPNMRKHVDPKAPVPIRGMAAKGLVPLSPSDMCGALFMLTFDPDPGIRETAVKTAGGLPDRILSGALRDEGLAPEVLGFFLGLLSDRDAYAELLLLNAKTPDEGIALIASGCSARIGELISQNQLRLLRHEEIIRGLCENPNLAASVVDSVCDFAVRSGIVLPDVRQMREARLRIHGPDVESAPPDPGPTAQELLEEFQEQLVQENAPPLEEGKRVSLTQSIMRMSISQKIKLATLGNKEARTLLMRDSNKLVAVAVIRSPRITDGEVMMAANNRAILDDVLRVIYGNRDWTKAYPIRLALVKNPKTPPGIALKFLGTLRESEIKDLARSKNIPSAVQMMAKKMMDKKNAPKQPGK